MNTKQNTGQFCLKTFCVCWELFKIYICEKQGGGFVVRKMQNWNEYRGTSRGGNFNLRAIFFSWTIKMGQHLNCSERECVKECVEVSRTKMFNKGEWACGKAESTIKNFVKQKKTLLNSFKFVCLLLLIRMVSRDCVCLWLYYMPYIIKNSQLLPMWGKSSKFNSMEKCQIGGNMSCRIREEGKNDKLQKLYQISKDFVSCLSVESKSVKENENQHI